MNLIYENTTRESEMSRETHRWLRFAITVILLLIMADLSLVKYNRDQKHKGEAISNYLSTYHSIDLPPDQAKYFNIAFTGVDIAIENLDVFESTVRRK